MRTPIVALLLLLAGTAVPAHAEGYKWPDTLFEEQMECGDLAKWRRVETKGGGSVELSTTTRHSGRYAAKCTVPPAEAERCAFLITEITHAPRQQQPGLLFARAYLYLNDDFQIAPDGTVSILGFGAFKPPPDGSFDHNMVEVAVRNDGGNLVLCLPKAAAGTTALARRTWYCLEARLTTRDEVVDLNVYLNGKPEFTVADLKLDLAPSAVSVGFIAADSPKTSGAVLVDDVVVDDKPIGPCDLGITLAYPDFRSRVGAPVIAILTGDQPGDSLVATLTSADGMRRTVLEKKGPLDGRVAFKVDLRGLPAATYTFTVKLLNAAGQERASAAFSYDKTYAGDPAGFAIDENNNILLRGKKIFPVLSWGLSRKKVPEWKQEGYVNLLCGMEWNDRVPGMQGYKDYLDAVHAAGMQCVGPGHDYRYDRPGKPKWVPEAVTEYLTALRDHPANAWWLWREEPVNWKYDAASQKLWWDLAKQHDPARPVEILEMAAAYQHGILRAKQQYYIWPWLTGDMYGWDLYPVENEHQRFGSFEDFAAVADRVVNWNMGLVPTLSNVQTADVTPGKKGGTPTPQEMLFMCWLSVVHNVKGIHWYHYQGETPPENYQAMSKFVKDTANLVEAILGDDCPVPVTRTELDGGRVDVLARQWNKAIYVFAVNLKRKPEKVQFTLGTDGNLPLGLPKDATVEAYGESRAIALDGATFSDSFEPLGYRIYRIRGEPHSAP